LYSEYREIGKAPQELGSVSEPLGRYATVFQSELYAILEASEALIVLLSKEDTIRRESVALYSDSLSSIKALSAYSTSSGLVKCCHDSLNELSLITQVTL